MATNKLFLNILSFHDALSVKENKKMNTTIQFLTIFICIIVGAAPINSQEKKPEKGPEKPVIVATVIPFETELKANDELKIPIDNKKISRVTVVIQNLLDLHAHFISKNRSGLFQAPVKLYQSRAKICEPRDGSMNSFRIQIHQTSIFI